MAALTKQVGIVRFDGTYGFFGAGTDPGSTDGRYIQNPEAWVGGVVPYPAWPVTPTGGGSGASSVAELTDVDPEGKLDLDFLGWSAAQGKWVPVGLSSLAVPASTAPMVHIQDQKPSGTVGGIATAGAYATRTLNTMVVNEINGASLAANVITLPAGTYTAKVSAPTLSTQRARLRLWNITDSAVLVLGPQLFVSGGANTVPLSLFGKFTLAATKTMRLEQRSQTALDTNDFGVASNWGDIEIFSEVIIRKVG